MKPLANDYVEIYKSPDPKNAYSGTPAICILRSGRYVFSHDLFTNNDASVCPEGLPKEVIPHPDSGLYHIGQIFTSDDSGKTWQKKP